MPSIRIAVQEVQRAANTDATAQIYLDAALVQLVRAVDGANESESTPEMSRLDAMETLAGIVQAGAMAGLAPAEEESNSHEDISMECDDVTTLELSSALQSIALLVGVDPRQPTAAGAAQEIQTAVQDLVSHLPPTFFEAVVPPGTLTESQAAMLAEVDTALQPENALRRRMLIERAKVTLQSFLWSRRLTEDGAKQAAEAAMEAGLSVMDPAPHVSLNDVFSATLGDVMTVTERATSTSESGAIRAKVKDVLIGSVPDRGGRTDGRRKVAMPEWSERKVTAGGRGGGRGRGRGRGGGGGGGQKEKK